MDTTNQPIFPKPIDFDSLEENEIEDIMNDQSDFTKIKLKAQKRAIEDKMTQYYKKLIDEEQYEHFSSTALIALKQLHAIKVKADNIYDLKNGANPYCFYTVNFKPEYDDKFETIEKEIKEFCSKQKYISQGQYAFSIEQRNEEGDCKGIHAHILFEKGKNSPSKLKRAFNDKFFDKYVGSPASLDYRYVKSPENNLKYIMGMKTKDKMPKVYHDRKLKKGLGLPVWNLKPGEGNFSEIIKTFECSEEYLKLFSHPIV